MSDWSPKPASGQPARGYTWPPFEPGNTAGERHGAHSPRRVTPVAERIATEIAAEAPWTGWRAFTRAAAALARTEAQIALVWAYIDAHGPLDDDGQPRSAVRLLDRLEARAARLRADLGMTPAGLARMLAQLSAVDTRRLRGEGADDLAALIDRLRADGRAALAPGEES